MSPTYARINVMLLLTLLAGWPLTGAAQVSAQVSTPEEPPAPAVRTITPQTVYAQQTAFRDQLLVGEGRFRAMTGAQRNQIAKRQRRVIERVRGLRSFDDLRPDQRTELFNDLQWLSAQLAGNEGDREVCEFTYTVGSRIQHSVCMTADQAEAHKRRSQLELRKVFACTSAGCVE